MYENSGATKCRALTGTEHDIAPIIGAWGQSPQRDPGPEPLVRGLKLKAF